jgi:TPR repeat protein
MQYETPWQRLHWTGSATLVLWILAAYGLCALLNSMPAQIGKTPSVNARFIEVPAPKTLPPPPQSLSRPAPRPSAAPAHRSSAPAKQAASSSSPPIAPAGNVQSNAAASDPAGLGSGTTPGSSSATGGTSGSGTGTTHGAAVLPGAIQEHSVGAAGRPLEQMVVVEDKSFDFTGLGDGISHGGWALEHSDGCSMPASITPCTSKGQFSQQPTPLCFDGIPDSALEVGSCKELQERAVRAYKAKDFASAFAIFKKLAEKDYAPSQFSLGAMYADGEGVDKDDQMAAYWYRKAADQGDVKGIYNLALMYREGRGVEKDIQQALRWYKKAAYYGYSLAQANLGLMYSEGIGVAKDDQRAAYWYAKAADRGNTSAQYNLGVMYEEGKGVPANEKKAMQWYCRGVTRGEANAMGRVKRMYGADLDGVTDDELKYFCYRFFVMFRTYIYAYTDAADYEQPLTEEQIDRAKRLDKIWRNK